MEVVEPGRHVPLRLESLRPGEPFRFVATRAPELAGYWICTRVSKDIQGSVVAVQIGTGALLRVTRDSQMALEVARLPNARFVVEHRP